MSLAFSVPLLVLGMSHGLVPAFASPVGRLVQWLLATLVVFGPGRRFFTLAFTALRHRTADMNTLVSLGVAASYGWSTVAVAAPQLFSHAAHGHPPDLYFEAAGAIVTFILLGKFLEARARTRLVSITLDPANDTTEALHAYARKRALDTSGWSLLTGSQEQVDAVTRGYGVFAARAADGTIDHLVAIFLIDPEGRIAERYIGLDHQPAEIAADIARILG